MDHVKWIYILNPVLTIVKYVHYHVKKGVIKDLIKKKRDFGYFYICRNL